MAAACSDSAPLGGATTRSHGNLGRFSGAARPSCECHWPRTRWMLPDNPGKDAELYRLASAIIFGLATSPQK
ncbi:hypothetical protein NDU88_006656 [Pleurodeles waltl]|uniref:Uncharacterized protein n=1 Tax=Pleurodeles waltl TaxID=8319 RepID=A0AAV7NU38_PLEWA|nr:hypothetical protein NDU88_006656 [Pleurodeles waltl]